MENVRISAYIPPADKARLLELGRENGLNASEYLRWLVKQHIEGRLVVASEPAKV